jgi:D-alanyl-D-alanine carboxypeptidase
MLLKRILEDVAGMSYRALVFERLARPLGLRRTFVAETIEDLAALAPAMSSALSVDGSARDVRLHYDPGWVSHGVVASTASEIVRFLDSLFGGRLLLPSSLNQMTVSVRVPEEKVGPRPENAPRRWVQPSYGLGLMADPASPCGLVLGHNGGGPGYSASAFHAIGSGASVCVMEAIIEDDLAERVAFQILDHLAGRSEVRAAQ